MTCFWSVDVPGRDPAILLWALWVSLALSRSLNLCHSPCGFLYNHLYCLPTTPLRVCVLRWLVAQVTSTSITSKSICNQQTSLLFHESSKFSQFSLFCTSNSILNSKSVNFRLVFREFRDCSENLSVCSRFS